MAKEQAIVMEGVVTDTHPNATFDIQLSNGHMIIGHVSGKIRLNNIRIIAGDQVTVELSPYDLKRGRITFRKKGGGND
jgi:translation initiation factor IF-1